MARLSRETGSSHIVVVGPKGGTGKTTTAAMLASILASSRGEIVSVLDATHQLGTLRRRLVTTTEPPTRPFSELCSRALGGELAAEWAALAPYVDTVGSLRVLRSLSSPDAEFDLSPEAFAAGLSLIGRASQLIVLDVGTKANGPVMTAALDGADALVLATEFAYDALELTVEMASALAGEPLSYRPDPDEWTGMSDGRLASLISNAIVVVSSGRSDDIRRRDPNLSMMLEWLGVVCGGGVVVVDSDDHLSVGGVIDQGQLEFNTVLAYTRVAASITTQLSRRDAS
ncbi:MAG: hypothetical protein WA860_14065 [Acidimicrobiales bacterium]